MRLKIKIITVLFIAFTASSCVEGNVYTKEGENLSIIAKTIKRKNDSIAYYLDYD